jgi:hypothetical protein
LHVTSRAARLRAIIGASHHVNRRVLWDDWLQRTPLFTLEGAKRQVTEYGLSPASIMQSIAGNAPRPWTQAVLRRIRSKFQGVLATKLRQRETYNPQTRMRCKLERWRLPGPPRVVADRVLRRLDTLRDKVHPRVSAAVLSTLWNRWTTRRRFQQCGGSCVLRCSYSAQDSIEHYARWPVIREAARTHLRLTLRHWPFGLADFLLSSGPPHGCAISDQELVRWALLVFAAYTTTNAARHRIPASAQESADMMQQAIWEGAANHPYAQQVLRTTWH